MLLAHLPFELVAGTVAGSAHVAAGRNNQDAFSIAETPAGAVAVVCDGCGSSAASEVGAKLAARLLVASLVRRLASTPDAASRDLLAGARAELLAELHALAGAMSGSDGLPGYVQTVCEYFLFTVVGVVLTAREVQPFSLGDGLLVVNGEERVLGPYPDNEPPYLAYALLPERAARRREPSFELHEPLPSEQLRSLLLASDGALDLEGRSGWVVGDAPAGSVRQFWSEDRFFRNPDALRRRLAVLNRGPLRRVFPDDTTVIALRRVARATT